MTKIEMRDTIDMAREAGFNLNFRITGSNEALDRLVEYVRADERMSFYGQDKPAECADGCPPNQICDYCQVVAPVKAMILAEREACAKVAEDSDHVVSGRGYYDQLGDADATVRNIVTAIRARGNT
jgi:hypothetical protein